MFVFGASVGSNGSPQRQRSASALSNAAASVTPGGASPSPRRASLLSRGLSVVRGNAVSTSGVGLRDSTSSGMD